MTRHTPFRRVVHMLALAAATSSATGCQACLEFDCTGGFRWIGLVPAEARQVQVRVETARSVFLHSCTLGGDALSWDSPCVVEVERLGPASDEESVARYSRDPDDVEPPRVNVRTFDPASADSMWTDESGPERADVEVHTDGTLVLEETYEPEYLEQSKGRGCGICQHQEVVTIDLRE